jgi:2-haloacid dehalogenase
LADFEYIQACVFDAYGTLFDVAAAARACQDDLGADWLAFSTLWRDKQLQYTWLRSLTGDYISFWQITQDSLDFALEAFALSDADLRQRLLEIYFQIDAYPEVPHVLRALSAHRLKTAILSNGSPDMLAAAVGNAGIELDAVLSVDALGVFKPDPRVYALAVEKLEIAAPNICFLSSNAWDAWSAAQFGFQVVWINRFNQPPERLPSGPKEILNDLHGLPRVLGID